MTKACTIIAMLVFGSPSITAADPTTVNKFIQIVENDASSAKGMGYVASMHDMCGKWLELADPELQSLMFALDGVYAEFMERMDAVAPETYAAFSEGDSRMPDAYRQARKIWPDNRAYAKEQACNLTAELYSPRHV